MNKAVFLDRDGTIVEDVGYMNSPEQIQFIPGSIEAIKILNEAGYKVVVISNQAGVARGLVTEDMLQTIDKTLHKWILNGGAHLDGIYYCPHHPEHGVYPYKQACECRKPHPGLIKKSPAGPGYRSFTVLHDRRQSNRHTSRQKRRHKNCFCHEWSWQGRKGKTKRKTGSCC